MQYHSEKLKQFAAQIMQKAGLEKSDSLVFAESLIKADMRGIGSHGISRLMAYARRVQEGLVEGNVRPVIMRDAGALLLVDAQNGMGAVTACQTMQLCMERAKQSGCCFAAVKGGNHFGYGAFFTEYAAAQDMIGVAIANSPSAMPPTGGLKPMLGTNPISVAIPARRHPPLVLDMATSVVARGKITLAKKEGRSIPDFWGVDARGNPTTDPEQVQAVLPFGGAKGYALSLIAELLCSCLSGALNGQTMGSFYDYSRVQESGFFLGAIHVGGIMPPDAFKDSVDALLDRIKDSPKAEGVSEIMIPGEIEFHNYDAAEKNGVSLSPAVVKELLALSEQYGVPFNLD